VSAVIRAGVEADIPEIMRMMREFEQWLCTLDGSEFSFDEEETAERLHRHGFGARPRFRTLIADGQSGPLGYAIYDVSFWADGLMPVILMSDFYVDPRSRRTGVGRSLMNHLAEIGQREGCEGVLWTVWRPNLSAQAFYEAVGAEAIDDERLMLLKITKD
jgi:GNAT superfamily N-acetyltransferase